MGYSKLRLVFGVDSTYFRVFTSYFAQCVRSTSTQCAREVLGKRTHTNAMRFTSAGVLTAANVKLPVRLYVFNTGRTDKRARAIDKAVYFQVRLWLSSLQISTDG